MTSPSNNPNTHLFRAHSEAPAFTSPEETLRVLANLPAPHGLAGRLHAGLHAAPRRTTLFGVFSGFYFMHSAALRTAAAAAIVCVVAGGGWQIYSRVQPAAAAKGVAIPAPAAARASGFSTAGAMRRPNPLGAPVITHQVHPIPNATAKKDLPPPGNKNRAGKKSPKAGRSGSAPAR